MRARVAASPANAFPPFGATPEGGPPSYPPPSSYSQISSSYPGGGGGAGLFQPGAESTTEVDPGVFISTVETALGQRELRRVRFSQKRFTELDAQRW
eukprot:778890-Prorocentrum_minimum.AAC.1